MNALLEKALAAAARLSDGRQEAIAQIILDEIEDERGWDERFAATQNQIGELVRRARVESGSGDRRK